MRWHDLLFLHWPLEPKVLRSLIPAGLTLDLFEGRAWLGVVPFRMSGVRPRCVPALPGVSAFPELNLRTYVNRGGRPGVWFFSLDVTQRLAVAVARRRFHLPYHHADMRAEEEGGWIDYASERRPAGPPAAFRARYRPVGEPFTAQPGSFEAWSTARYCLYSADARGRLFRGEIHHAPWPLQLAEVDLQRNAMTAQVGLAPLAGEPLGLFARRLDVVAWPLAHVESRLGRR